MKKTKKPCDTRDARDTRNEKPGKAVPVDDHGFPVSKEDWTHEDRRLSILLTGLRLHHRGSRTPWPFYDEDIKFYFAWLGDQAWKEENPEAVKRLYSLAHHAVDALVNACFMKPELFQPIARSQIWWPGMLGGHPFSEWCNERLRELLQLGASCPLNIRGKSFSMHNPESFIAVEIWDRIETWRQEQLRSYGDPTVCSLVMPKLPGLLDPREWGLTDNQIQQLKQLDPLSRRNSEKWWRAAEPVFLHFWGANFEDHKDFEHYWRNVAYKGEPNARALIRRDIKKKIRQAFRSIAPKQSAV